MEEQKQEVLNDNQEAQAVESESASATTQDAPVDAQDAPADVSEDKNEEELARGGQVPKGAKVKSVVKKYAKRYFIDAFTGMAQGLFCTLIAGTILGQIASWCGDNGFAYLLKTIANLAKMMMGVGIGVGIAHKLGAKPLVIFTAAVTGLIGAWAMQITDGTMTADYFSVIYAKGLPGNPIGAYIVALLTVEVAGLYAGKTKLDIVLIPLGMLILCLAGVYIAWPFIKLIDLIAKVLVLAIEAGEAVKIIVGIFVAVVMGVLLTMPTSSAAIWVSIATSSVALAHPDVFAIAGGAAVAGCSAHMIGFAVASFRENKWSGLVSQGIGTSMLQIPNIMKRPIIMVPEIIASAVAGLVAVLLGLRCNASGGGMGTSGLVGVFGTIDASMSAGLETWKLVVGIILCLFVIPAGVSLGFSELFRKFNLIKFGDQKLD